MNWSCTTVKMFVSCLLILSCRRELEPQLNSTESMQAVSRSVGSPNVILILADDFGYELPNYTGGQSYQTPNLNALAESGMQFTQCRALPLCSPSRFELLTGKYNFRNYTSWGILNPAEMTIAKLLKANGYATCVAGKWQLDGGDTAIKKLGFDSYSVAMPFISGSASANAIENYKNPIIYQNAAFVPLNQTKGKYGEDIFREYMINFIKANRSNKFFVFWTPNLLHKPFCPTPDDPEFATWNNKQKPQKADTIYFPSMVKYLDKQIGMLRDSLAKLNLLNNTLILFTGDNGTHTDKTSLFQGQPFRGGKSFTLEAGIHVPLIACMPGTITSGSFNNNLVDFSDFFTSIADFVGVNTTGIDSLDGVSFAPAMQGLPGETRQYNYTWYNRNTKRSTNKPIYRYVNDTTYKLYKDENGSYRFYNFKKDPMERNPITHGNISPDEIIIYVSMKATLDRYP